MKITTPITTLFSILFFFTFTQSSYATPVNINKADARLIASSLSGIGKHKAKAIINYREKDGFFEKAMDIVNVKGIGKATYNKNKSDILIH